MEPGQTEIRRLGGGGGKPPLRLKGPELKWPKLSALAALLALAALIGALLAGSLLTLAPAQADGHPNDIELVLSVDDSDGVIAPGSEFTVSAALRFTGPHTLWRRLSIADARLRLPGVLDWAAAAGSNVQEPDDQTVMGAALYRPTGTDGEPVGDTALVVALAMHQRTLLARSNDQELYVYDVWNKQQAAVITPPATADGPTFGRPPGGQDNWHRQSGGVWQESDTTAWLFIGSNGDEISSVDNVGSLYIYKLDWSADPPSVTMVKRLVPPQSEFSNMRGSVGVRYGSAVGVSADGGTLAVGAQRMNNMGAVYVYSRPDGAGEDWSDIEYADGVKLTAAPTPAWGAAGTRPFNPDVLADCDAYCSRVSSLIEDGDANFGTHKIGLSEDGRVISIAASTKRYPFDTAGGAFSGGTADVGEVYVFVAPAGGWQAAPEASGTLIGAGEDASNFDPETHYSPGPARRITAPAAVLLARRWADATANRYFGQQTTVSADGSTIAASEGGANSVQIFQRDSAADWAGELLPSATISGGGLGYGAWGGLAFNRDASVLLIANGGHSGAGQYSGAVDVLTRPASGTWADAAASTAVRLVGPVPSFRGFFGYYTVQDLDYERLAISHPSHLGNNRAAMGIYLSDGNCTVRIVDGLSTTTCPITFDGKVEVLPGTPQGAYSLFGEVTLSVDGVAGSAIKLNDALDITIGEVQELAEARLDFAADDRGTTDTSDDRPFPASIAAGQRTRFHIQLLNENGKPSAPAGVVTVLLTATAGRLSTAAGGGCEGGASDGGLVCSIDTAALTNADAGRILVDLRHGGQPAVAEVRLTAVSSTGETRNAEPLTVTLTGPPDSLAIAPPATALLNLGTPDAGADRDNRDLLTLAVTAADRSGNRVDAPTNGLRAWLLGPDGKRVTSGVELEWPLGGADNPTLDAQGNRQIRINVNRAATQPLAHGEYTLEIRAGALTAAQTFTVGGGPASLTLGGVEGTLAEGEQISLTATVLDSAGNPVPNDTPVEWSATDVGATPVLIQLSADAKTTNGKASASWLVLSTAAAAVRAQAGDQSDLRLLDVAAAMAAAAAAVEPPEPPAPADGLTSRNPGLTAWFGEGTTTAAALLADLPGVNSILFWSGSAWLRYAQNNGQPIPGSFNFQIPNAAILYLSE